MGVRRLVVPCVLVGAAGWLAVACGSGSNPAQPAAAGVRVEGTVLGGPVGVVAQAGGQAAAGGGPITVTVKEKPSLSATVPGSGTFTLEGLPEGHFTLAFTEGGVTLGEVLVTGASGDATVKVVVRVSGHAVVVVQLDIDGRAASPPPPASACAISGGTVGQPIELEGAVGALTGTADSPAFTMDVNGNRSRVLVQVDAGNATFRCVGNAKGGACLSHLQPGAKVHVSGTLESCTAGPSAAATVEATEVKIQK